MTRYAAIVLVFILSFAIHVDAATPQVVITSPDNGEIDVSPDIKEIRVEFDQPMNPRGRSIIGGGDNFPEISGEMKWLNEKTFIIPVTLKANHEYWLSINSDTFKGFRSQSGQPVDWYPIHFKTQGAGPMPPDVTPQQNKAALEALKKAIDQDYSYRDLKKVDWTSEIAKRQAKFENAATANEFARLAAHLLRLAQDGHVSVQAGDVGIGTCSNSTPPNFNIQTLQKAVPGWTEHPSGIITGRFAKAANGSSIGYILFSECTKPQADGFDAALDEMKDTGSLIIDARFNGGGGEDAALQVAGRFVEKPTVYAKDRIRQAGNWTGLIDRVVQPRNDPPRYTKPVAVLIGPKIVSSAESFVLMMQQGAKAKLIGDATGGSSGRPMPHPLGNGVTVYLSSWEDELPDGTLLQGNGVHPDISVATLPRFLEQSDAVLEAALNHLRHQDTAANAPVGK